MAPEVVARTHEYSKSVDIWAIGIIMHEILTGKHPFYNPETDTYDSVKRKIQNLKRVEPNDSFSWIAKNLFSRLTQVQSH